MSRSHRHSPFMGITTAHSEKLDKQLAHRRERRVIRAILSTDPERDTFPHFRELSNVWSFAKDGKQMISRSSPYFRVWMRK